MVIDIEHSHHKRSRSSLSDEQATKKPKITDERVKMDPFAFQTPHPNLGAQSVAYQLPSSSPKPSPGALSPVPSVPIPKKRERSRRKKTRTGPNATSTPVQRKTDTTPPSFILSSADCQQESRNNHDFYQSASRPSHSSKSTTSSRASSRERKFRKPRLHHRQPTRQLKHAKSLGALDGDNSSTSTHMHGAKKHNRSTKGKGTKQLLDSPYVSRASSPVPPERAKKAHISTSEAPYKPKHLQMLGPPLALPGSRHSPPVLTDALYHANTPSISRHHSRKYKTQTHDKMHHENIANRNKPSSTRRSAKGTENQIPQTTADKSSNLERRRSAPNGLTAPRSRRPVLQPSGLSSTSKNHSGKIAHPRTHSNGNPLQENVERIINGMDDPGATYPPHPGLRPAASMQELYPLQDRGHFLKNIRQSDQQSFSVMPYCYDAHPSWMYARAGVDFNRPPSQLDVNIGISQGDAGDNHWSSSSEEDEDFWLTNEKNRSYREPNIDSFGHRNNFEPDLNPRIVDGFLQSDERALGRLLTSLPSHDFPLDDDIFARDIRGFSTPANLQGVQGLTKRQINHAAFALRKTASFASFTLQKLSESPPSDDAQDGLQRSSSCSDLQDPYRRPRKDLALSVAHKASTTEGEEVRKSDPDGERDMELTQRVDPQCLHLDGPRQRIVPSPSVGQDTMTWVTDSIVSPPTAFLKWKKRNDKDLGISKHNDNHFDQESQKSTTSSDSTITSISHESSDVNNAATDERSAAENEDLGQDAIVVVQSTTKRTRSGTIMPASPGTISRTGARRTRSGTIIGPIVASAAATAAESGSRLAGGISSLLSTVVGAGKTRQTRSGTIVASASINAMPTTVIDSGIGMSISNGGRQQNRSRSGSMLRIPKAVFQPMITQNNSEQSNEGRDAAANTRMDPEVMATVQEVGGLVDSAYFPPSSPDELDIIFAPCPEDDVYNLDEEWRVAEEPASPEAGKKRGKGGNRGSSHTVLGLAARAANAGRWLKSKSSRTGTSEGSRTGKAPRVHFEAGVSGSGPEDVIELDSFGGADKAVPSSDDALLLVPGATAALFR